MASGTQVNIFGKTYTVKGADSGGLQELATFVDSKMQELASATKASPADLPVLTALNIAQDFFDLKQELETLKEQSETEKNGWEERLSRLAERLDTEMKRFQKNSSK